MCLAIPGKVESIDYPFAVVSFKGTKKKIRIDLIDDLKVGDYVLVHVGFAIQKVDEAEAKRIQDLISKIVEL